MSSEIQSYIEQLKVDALPRPNYGFILMNAALLAKGLGKPAISAIEFGVAQGDGLQAMEKHAAVVQAFSGVRIDVIGFDNATGLPDHAADYRDAPHVWQKGMFKMDVDAVRAKLKSAKLVFGDVKDTVPQFLAAAEAAPVGAISFDLDYYTSTKNSFGIFDLPALKRLPRIFTYFDDLFGNSPFQAFNEFIGQQLAIREYNDAHDTCKLTPLPQLKFMRRNPSIWNEKIFVHHDFPHPEYTTYIPQDEYKPYL